MPCYVLGCHSALNFYVERQHKHFGTVISCLEHDPARFGYEPTEPQSVAEAEAPAEPEQTPEQLLLILMQGVMAVLNGNNSKDDGGKKVRRPIAPKPLGPTPSIANPF